MAAVRVVCRRESAVQVVVYTPVTVALSEQSVVLSLAGRLRPHNLDRKMLLALAQHDSLDNMSFVVPESGHSRSRMYLQVSKACCNWGSAMSWGQAASPVVRALR